MSLKRIYELSVSQLQEALSLQSRTAKEEGDRLRGQLEGLEKKYARDVQSLVGMAPNDSKKDNNKSKEKPSLRFVSGGSNQLQRTDDVGGDKAEDDPSSAIQLLQHQLNQKAEELRRARQELFIEREQHESEMAAVRDNFTRMKQSQQGESEWE